jgi:sugar (glycoside-pentoside-hexuronide) transporter
VTLHLVSTSTGEQSGLGAGLRFGYGVGAIGTGVYATVPGLLLLYYMTDTLGVGAAVAGVGIFVPKLWDVITDPFMGTISDRTRSRWGRRRPYLLAGGLSLPVCFALLFACPLDGPTASFVWVMVMYLLAATAFTVFSVPWTAMPAEMSEDYDEFTGLMGWRVALLTVGVLLSGALAPMLVELGGGGRSGYTLMGATLGAVMLVMLLGCFWGTRRAPSLDRREDDAGLWTQLAEVARVRPFVVLVGAFALQLVGVGVILAAVPYFARYILDDAGALTILFVALVGPAFAFMPVWVRVSRVIGKLPAYVTSVSIFSVGALSLWLASAETTTIVYAQVAVIGVGWAGTQLCPFSMLPDTMTADREDSGQRREGVFTGVWMAIDKGGMAIGALLTGLALDAGGFVESAEGVVVTQPGSALTAIRVSIALLPAMFMLVSLPILRGYELDRERRDLPSKRTEA